MKTSILTEKDLQSIARFNREKQKLGLIYGLLAGAGFALSTWGYDAVLLAQSSAAHPFLKLVIGGLFCLVVGGFVGWLVEKVDHGLVSFLAWLLVGASFAWITSQLPFDITSRIINLLDPRFGNVSLFPYPSNVNAMMIVVSLATLVMAGATGALETYLVETASSRPSPVGRFLLLAASLVFFTLAGNAADNVNQSLRDPIISTNQALIFARQNAGKPVDKALANQMHLRSVEPLGDLLNKPYKIYVGQFEPVYMDSVVLYLDFGDEWGLCSTMMNDPTFCQPSKDDYIKKMSCLLGGQGDGQCSVGVSDQAQTWLSQQRSSLGPKPAMRILSEQGTVTLLGVEGQDKQQYLCQFSGAQYTTTLLGCQRQSRPLFTVQEQDYLTSHVQQTVPDAQSGPTPAPILPSEPPKAGFASQEAAMLPSTQVDLKTESGLNRYLIALNIDYPNHSFRGHLTLFYTNTQTDTLSTMVFRLYPNGGKEYGDGNLSAYNVDQDGQRVDAAYSMEKSTMEVDLPTSLKPGGRTTIDMDFEGKTPLDYGGGYGIFNFTSNEMALSGWFPILAAYVPGQGWDIDQVTNIGDSAFSQSALYTVDIALSKDLVMAASGVEISRYESGDMRVVRMVTGPVRDFEIVVSPQFQVKSGEVNGTRINAFYLPSDAGGGDAALDVASKSLAAFNAKFGLYPFTELDVVEMPMQGASGVEFPGLVEISARLYSDPTAPAFATTVAHEVAHQWWYSVVGDDVIDDPWLDEGLTTYSSTLYFEAQSGKSGYQGMLDYYKSRYNSYLLTGKDDLITESVPYYESMPNSGAYSAIVYAKSAVFFDALRAEIGDEAFFKALQNYYRDYKYGVAWPDSLLNEFKTASGKPLDAFFKKWLYTK